MTPASCLVRWALSWTIHAGVALLAVLGGVTAALPAHALAQSVQSMSGTVESNAVGLPDYSVSLYGSFPGIRPYWKRLGSATTNKAGNFSIPYFLPTTVPRIFQPVLFIVAENGPAMLTSAIGRGPSIGGDVVVNERTTVATGVAFAQFIGGRKILGNLYGMRNAIRMAANLADPKTGNVGEVLLNVPNGTETSTFPTFNSLTNVIASCVAKNRNCLDFFAATTPPGRPAPTTVLEAIANIAKYPSYPGYPLDADDPLFELSLVKPIYQPALTKRPTSWLLFVKFTGGFYSAREKSNLLNGPGNFAIDERGFVWVNDNFVPQPPNADACAGRRLVKFYPWGESFPGSPYFGGGLDGAGWGITLDPAGKIWVGNFGFEAPACGDDPLRAAEHKSVSLFRPNGVPISPKSGYRKGHIFWPQATVSDRKGNIWLANCGNDSVTLIPSGNPSEAFNIPLPFDPNHPSRRIKPFGLAIDLAGNAWVTGSFNNTVTIIAPDGTVIATLTSDRNGPLFRPMVIAPDSHGNMWVANSDVVDVPCPPPPSHPSSGKHPSISLYTSNHVLYPGSPFTGGGLTLPWGLIVDGNDTVWVPNFGVFPNFDGQRDETDELTALSHFCGTDPTKCPPGRNSVGSAISPDTGYTSDALDRITAAYIDLSGNIWLTNNYQRNPKPNNPGGNSIVVVVGAAGPVQTPVIGPPVPAPH
jgi:hypothetical protein